MSLESLTPEEQRQFHLGRLLQQDPEVRRQALRLAKKVDPKLNLPEIELEDRLEAQAAEFNKQLEKRDQEEMDRRVAARKRERDAEIVAAGFTVEEIEQIIVRERCTYETAMKIANMEHQLAEPSASDYHNTPHAPIDPRPGKEWSALGIGGLKKKSAQIASDMINEFRGRGARRTTAR